MDYSLHRMVARMLGIEHTLGSRADETPVVVVDGAGQPIPILEVRLERQDEGGHTVQIVLDSVTTEEVVGS